MPRPSKAPAIAGYLAAHYPCEALPLGALSDVGTIFGVTRERVRQIAKAGGFVAWRDQDPAVRVYPKGRTGYILCRDCFKPTGRRVRGADRISRTRCADCRTIAVVCTYCGTPKLISTTTYLAHMREPAKPTPDGKLAKYTGRTFCNRSCFGRWIAEHHGFQAHPENAGAVSARTAADNRQHILDALPGTYAEIAHRTGLSYQTVYGHCKALRRARVVNWTLLTTTGTPHLISLRTTDD